MWTRVSYTGKFKQVQLLEVMSGGKKGFLKIDQQVFEVLFKLTGDQILILCIKILISSLKIIVRGYLSDMRCIAVSQ